MKNPNSCGSTLLSTVGIEKFLYWNRRVPNLELKSSCLGTKKFQEGNHFWNSQVIQGQCNTNDAECGEAKK